MLRRAFLLASLCVDLVVAFPPRSENYSEAVAKMFYGLASSSYCESRGLEDWSCLPCKASNVTFTSFRKFYNKTGDTHAFVAANQEIIVLSIRGTETLANWIEDLKIAKTDKEMGCPGCKVHSGFLDVWRAIETSVVAEIHEQMVLHPSAKLYTTGHSLGAGVATLAAYVLRNDFGLPVHADFSYGSPRVGNQEFANFINASPMASWRFTHNRDIVIHLPFESMGFSHIGREVFYNKDSTAYTVCDGSGEDAHCSDSIWIADSVSDHLHYFNILTGENGC